MQINCCIGNYSTSILSTVCSQYYKSGSNNCNLITDDYVKTPNNLKNIVFKNWILDNSIVLNNRYDSYVTDYCKNNPTDIEFCACGLPVVWDSNVPTYIQQALASQPQCTNATCGANPDAYKWVNNLKPCNYEFQNCVNTVNINNQGTITGAVNIKQTPECNQYSNNPNTIPIQTTIPTPIIPTTTNPTPIIPTLITKPINPIPTPINPIPIIPTPTKNIVIAGIDLTGNNQNLFLIMCIILMSLIYVLFSGRNREYNPPQQYYGRPQY